MNTIYRIQDLNGRGPFKPGFSQKWVQSRPDHENLIPYFEQFGPVHERILIGAYSGCGCQTLNQLRRWFSKKEYRKLKKFGYHAVKIDANRIIAKSDIQCVFVRAIPLNESIEIIKLY